MRRSSVLWNIPVQIAANTHLGRVFAQRAKRRGREAATHLAGDSAPRQSRLGASRGLNRDYYGRSGATRVRHGVGGAPQVSGGVEAAQSRLRMELSVGADRVGWG